MAIRISRYLKETWLRKEDVDALSPAQCKTSITRVYSKKVGNDEKLVVAFDGITRHLPLNQENLKVLVAAIGGVDDAAEFVGLKVELYVDESVEYQNEAVGGIRLGAQPKERPGSKK